MLQIEYEVTQIKRRSKIRLKSFFNFTLFVLLVQELEDLQQKHCNRPDVFDDVEEEHAIDILTAEISQVQNYIIDFILKLQIVVQ